jgi:tRNA(fMet)-specific endonuclease VapC
MKRYLLDTNSASAYIFRRRGVRERAMQARADGAKIGIGLPVVAEILAGIEYSTSRDKNLDIVNRHLQLFLLWPFTLESARIYGRLYAETRRAGRTMQTMNLLIASIALSLGNCTVVSNDSDMQAVPGLAVEDWVQ